MSESAKQKEEQLMLESGIINLKSTYEQSQ